MFARTMTGIALAAALLASGQAQAASKGQCLTKPELRGVVAFAMPIVLEGVIERCLARLPSDAYLLRKGPAMVTGLRAGQEAAWPLARKGIMKLGGASQSDMAMIEDLPLEMAEPLFGAMIEDRLLKDMKSSDCTDANAVLQTLEPLKPDNMVDFITEVMVIGAREDKEIQVCKAG